MQYTKEGKTVRLEMSADEYALMLLMTGYAAGAAMAQGEPNMFWRWIDLANRMNTGNPEFLPYEIPREFRR